MPAWPTIDRRERSVPSERFPIVACLGHLNNAKRIPQLLQAFQRSGGAVPDALLVLAGSVAPGLRRKRSVSSKGCSASTTRASALWQLLADCDVCVSLRWPTMGETSGMAIRALSLGKPLVVSDAGWFSELPDSVAAKVPVDEFEVTTLAAVIDRLAEDDELRARMSAAAVEYARREHDLDRVADLSVGERGSRRATGRSRRSSRRRCPCGPRGRDRCVRPGADRGRWTCA